MMTVDEALQAIRQQVAPGPILTMPVEEALGCTLVEAVHSDVAVPPFDKSMMDGFAIRLSGAGKRLPVVGIAKAGGRMLLPVQEGQAVRIMTGAAVPQGVDAVVMFEQCDETAVGVLVPSEVTAEQNIQRRGSLVAEGALVAAPGHVIAAKDLGALIEAGAARVTVRQRPSIAVLATGDELVPPAHMPTDRQIRNTNGPMLEALARQQGLEVVQLGIAGDEPAALRAKMEQGLTADVLLLSGGVSAGDFDLVPQMLADAGVERIFHKVRVKPGKPIWFGRRAGGSFVFGLPGNPVSALVGFQVFVRAALERLQDKPAERPVTAKLACSFHHRGNRETLFPACFHVEDDGGCQVEPVPWRGSADLGALLRANGLIRFPAGDQTYDAGQRVAVYPFPPAIWGRPRE